LQLQSYKIERSFNAFCLSGKHSEIMT